MDSSREAVDCYRVRLIYINASTIETSTIICHDTNIVKVNAVTHNLAITELIQKSYLFIAFCNIDIVGGTPTASGLLSAHKFSASLPTDKLRQYCLVS